MASEENSQLTQDRGLEARDHRPTYMYIFLLVKFLPSVYSFWLVGRKLLWVVLTYRVKGDILTETNGSGILHVQVRLDIVVDSVRLIVQTSADFKGSEVLRNGVRGPLLKERVYEEAKG